MQYVRRNASHPRHDAEAADDLLASDCERVFAGVNLAAASTACNKHHHILSAVSAAGILPRPGIDLPQE